MAKRHKPKPGYLGPAFYAWLEHLEKAEAIGRGAVSAKGRQRMASLAVKMQRSGYHINNELFPEFNGGMEETIREMLWCDSWLAGQVRASVKYTVDIATLTEVRKKYSAAFDHILETMIVDAPFPNTTVCFTGLGPDDIVVNVSQLSSLDDEHFNKITFPSRGKRDRIVGSDVQEVRHDTHKNLGLSKKDHEFYSASMAFHRTRGPEFGRSDHVDIAADGNPDNLPPHKLSNVPVEIHFNKSRKVEETVWLNAIAPGVNPSPRGKDTVDMVRILLLNFFASFWLSSQLRVRQLGLPPQVGAKAPSHKKRKRDKPRFEHWVVAFELDAPEPESLAEVSKEQPKKKRHQVRGFPRKAPNGGVFKSGPFKGKHVGWVSGHHRGDARLGIVRKDFEIVIHEVKDE